MTPVCLSDARRIYLASQTRFVCQEVFDLFYDGFSGMVTVEAYLTAGCLSVLFGANWYIHTLNESSDLMTAVAEVLNRINSDEHLFVFTLGDAPEKFQDCAGSYKLYREAKPFFDPDIRPLSSGDADQIAACCAPDAEDTSIGQRMAREALEWAKNPDVFSGGVFGLFREGLLCGFVDGDLYPEVGITTVDLFVNRQHRGQGYARRLLNAFCARPGTVYCYSCVKTNLASYRTALSCGFRKVGEYLLIV